MIFLQASISLELRIYFICILADSTGHKNLRTVIQILMARDKTFSNFSERIRKAISFGKFSWWHMWRHSILVNGRKRCIQMLNPNKSWIDMTSREQVSPQHSYREWEKSDLLFLTNFEYSFAFCIFCRTKHKNCSLNGIARKVMPESHLQLEIKHNGVCLWIKHFHHKIWQLAISLYHEQNIKESFATYLGWSLPLNQIISLPIYQ